MQQRIDYTVALVEEAGKQLLEIMKVGLEIETKSALNDFVTNADKLTERFLIEGINRAYKDQDFLTEEKTTAYAGFDDLWIIDPIDGTTNFIFEQRNFAISIAYYSQKKPIFGIVYDVVGQDLFLGIVGDGAYLNGEKIEALDPQKKLHESILFGDLYSLSLFEGDAQALREEIVAHRYLGAASLEICGVAINRHQAYISRNLKVWDVAAAVIVLACAQGTWFFGGLDDDIYYNDDDGVFISAANSTIKDSLKNLMHAEHVAKK